MSASIDLLAVSAAGVVVEITDGPTPVADHRGALGLDTMVCADPAAAVDATEPGSVDVVVVSSVDQVSAVEGLLVDGGALIVAPPGVWSDQMSTRYDHALGENRNLRDRVISLTDIAEKAKWETESIKRSRSYRLLEPFRRAAVRLASRR